jgi:Skp family chaperone for outer membrane proteins
MNTFFRHLSLTLALGLAAFSVQAEEIRIGFINTDRIFK